MLKGECPMPIGVTGCNIELPKSFPIDFKDNAGNMIHANAPLFMFEDCYHSSNINHFPKFVNEKCSHLIVTMANRIRLGKKEEPGRHNSFMKFISSIKKPIVIFGLGVQANSEKDIVNGISAETVDFLQFLDRRATVIGVRGNFTQRVIMECANIKNVFVTGCPSLFSQPNIVHKLRSYHKTYWYRPAFSGTLLNDPLEQSLIANAIRRNTFYIEPFNKGLHSFHKELQLKQVPFRNFPYFLRRLKNIYGLKPHQIQEYFKTNYCLFRNILSWFTFIKGKISFNYGTRFHVNMAAFLSGRPAVWITHDTRTRELVDYFKLPSIELPKASDMPPDEIEQSIDLIPFYDNYHKISKRFNDFLKIAGLPSLNFRT